MTAADAFAKFLESLPDKHELSPHHIARDREIFMAGFSRGYFAAVRDGLKPASNARIRQAVERAEK